MSDPRDAEALLTVKEYAALFRRHQQTIYKAIYKGKLPYPLERATDGGRVLIRVPVSVIDNLRAA